jgi:hypothetical protein
MCHADVYTKTRFLCDLYLWSFEGHFRKDCVYLQSSLGVSVVGLGS